MSLDQLLKRVGGNIFCLARIAMVRAVEIHYGNPSMVDRSVTDKETTIALREIAQGKIVFKNQISQTG